MSCCSKHSLDGTLQEVRELLDRAVLNERKQLARDVEMDDGDRALREMQLDNLPSSTAAAVSELAGYDWQSQESRADYEKIKDLLGREMLDQRFKGMKEALENATDEDRQRIREMLADLNDLLEKHRRGEDTEQDFADFMDKHGDFFPENPRNIDELMDALAQRAAAAQRMRNSMTQEQRDELDALAAQAFGSPELMQSLAQLDDNLRALRPGEDWGGSEEFGGEEGLGLGDGTGVLQDLADLDELAEQLSQSYGGARMEDVDVDKLARQLGERAGVDARTLAELERALNETGYLKRGSDGQLRLSPKAMRQLGKALLKDVADRMSGRQGQRDLRHAGAAGELSGASREWTFGDTEPWNVTRTVTNAVLRSRAEGAEPDPATGRPAYASTSATSRSTRPRRAPRQRSRSGRHVVLDGDGEPLGADEADRARAAPADHQPVPRRPPEADRVRPHGPVAMDIEELTAWTPCGTRAPTCTTRCCWPTGTSAAPQCPAGAADRHRRRADRHLEPDGEVVVRLPAAPADRRGDRRGRWTGAPARVVHVLPARRRPAAGAVHRPDGRAGRRARCLTRARRPRRGRGRQLSRWPRGCGRQRAPVGLVRRRSRVLVRPVGADSP